MTDEIHNISIGNFTPANPVASTPARDRVRATAPTSDVPSVGTVAPDLVNSGQGNYFEALRDSKDRSAIPAAMVNLRPQILRLMSGLNRKMLAAIGQYLVDNDGIPKYAVGLIANYSTPVRAHSACGDKDAQKIYDDYFSEWRKRADFTRRHTQDQLQRVACRAIDAHGDIGATMTTENGFPQVRLFDTFHIGTLTGLDPKDGVETDLKGVLQGYKVIDGPVDSLIGVANRFIPADQMILLRDKERWTDYRGFSPIRTGSNDLRDKNDIKAFTKLKEKIGAALAAVIQQKGLIEEDVWGQDTGTGGSQESVNNDDNATPPEKKLSLAELLGGDIPIIEGEIKQLEHTSPGVDAVEFMQHLAGQFVAGLELPPAFFLDEKLTGPNVRGVLGKAQKKFDSRKQVMSEYEEFCFIRVIAWGIQNDGLPAVPNWWKVTFQFPPLMYIDLGDVMNNERQDVMCGQMSEHERFANRGKDATAERKRIADEIEEKIGTAVAIKNKFQDANIPIEIILSRMGFGQLALRATFDDGSQGQQGTKEETNNTDTSKKKDKKK